MIELVTFASQMLLFIANEIKTRNGNLRKFLEILKEWRNREKKFRNEKGVGLKSK